jgi:hypothetical protein
MPIEGYPQLCNEIIIESFYFCKKYTIEEFLNELKSMQKLDNEFLHRMYIYAIRYNSDKLNLFDSFWRMTNKAFNKEISIAIYLDAKNIGTVEAALKTIECKYLEIDNAIKVINSAANMCELYGEIYTKPSVTKLDDKYYHNVCEQIMTELMPQMSTDAYGSKPSNGKKLKCNKCNITLNFLANDNAKNSIAIF